MNSFVMTLVGRTIAVVIVLAMAMTAEQQLRCVIEGGEECGHVVGSLDRPINY